MFDRLLQNNTVVKIIASVLAVLLWFIVHSGSGDIGVPGSISTVTQALRDKPVKVMYDDRNYSLVGEPKVNLTMRGSSLDIMSAITAGDTIKAFADATDLKEGTHEVPVSIQGQPPGITIDPATVTIRLEANVNKEVSIRLETEGKPKDGLSVGDALVTPKTVIVSGARSAVETVDSVIAQAPVDNAEETIHTSAPLTPVDKSGKAVKNVHLSRDRVDVNIPISRPSKSVPVRLQFKGDLPAGLAVESVNQATSVTLYGPSTVLDATESIPAEVIDLSTITKSTTVKVKLTAPEGTTIEPSQIDVGLNVVQAAQRTFTGVPVKFNGLKEGQSYTLVSPSDKVDITVEGAKSLLDKLTPGDISASVDLSNQPAGRNEVHVQVNTPMFIKPITTNPQTIVLDLKK